MEGLRYDNYTQDIRHLDRFYCQIYSPNPHFALRSAQSIGDGRLGAGPLLERWGLGNGVLQGSEAARGIVDGPDQGRRTAIWFEASRAFACDGHDRVRIRSGRRDADAATATAGRDDTGHDCTGCENTARIDVAFIDVTCVGLACIGGAGGDAIHRVP